MLDSRVQHRYLSKDRRRSVYSPVVNRAHHNLAQRYYRLASEHCQLAESYDTQHEGPSLLVARILLAYYHHASTNHLEFRKAVWETVGFVSQNATRIQQWQGGQEAVQLWHRLCTSHRPAKPPSMPLEGEGPSIFGPNLDLPNITGDLYLSCRIGISTDDLVYDILIRTIEIRSRIVVFRCTAGVFNISEGSSELGGLAHALLNKLTGRSGEPGEHDESQAGFVKGSHLHGLLETQTERLKVWKSRIASLHLPANSLFFNAPGEDTPPQAFDFENARNLSHRDAMNALYYLLCVIMIQEIKEAQQPRQPRQPPSDTTANLAHNFCQIVEGIDHTISNTSDVYTLSVVEVLLQLVYSFQSESIFHYVLDVIWPRIEARGRGYEHSHYPTHLAKRIIAQLADEWARGRTVSFAQPAVAEDVSKLKLLDLDTPVGLVVYGHDWDRKCFVEKIPLL
ncbi:uncharacterized protein A1O9_08803 [Exophiala aquamarina CBS 119918]|uniref:Transcription factor domain-containing protein n=1 Tax=Exophiala aquamarina CBS 119918 TaxID=1182545 RepID=A0A072P4V5_9EURO|nr:uncharacterized protein A1O9_08803 [Exophiala aquamarina CBS 119918]KEF55149.1 hypothetical protein A1O9_08803 [Exophiala aquamarina CBS 119918]